MKDISKVKKKIQLQLIKTVTEKDPIKKEEEIKKCQMVAQTLALYYTVLPSGFSDASIFDFNGKNKKGDKKQLLSPAAVSTVKKQIIEYCWGKDDKQNLIDIDMLSSSDLDKKSIMKQRRVQGKNVVICANSTKVVDQKMQNSSRGKTFIASIIMRQAIKSRLNKGFYQQSYDWLKYSLIAEKMKKYDDEQLANSRCSDWLVIDDIGYESKYIRDIVDPFIMERLEDGLPTIFVCRFPVSKMNEEEWLGSGLSQVFHDRQTTIMNLDE